MKPLTLREMVEQNSTAGRARAARAAADAVAAAMAPAVAGAAAAGGQQGRDLDAALTAGLVTVGRPQQNPVQVEVAAANDDDDIAELSAFGAQLSRDLVAPSSTDDAGGPQESQAGPFASIPSRLDADAATCPTGGSLGALDGSIHADEAAKQAKAVARAAAVTAAAATGKRAPYPVGAAGDVCIDWVNNETGYFLAPHNSAMTIHKEIIDAVTGMRSVVPVRREAFELHLKPYTVDVLTSGGTKTVPIAGHWIGSVRRREHSEIVMQPMGATPPGVYNLWSGFAVKPMAGDASPYTDHILMLMHGGAGDAGRFLDRMAFCLQFPGVMPGVAVVLKGKQGTGKGTAYAPPMRALGHHARQVTSAKQATGNFNAHTRNSVLMFYDEAGAPREKESVGVMNALITEKSRTIEHKGQDIIFVDNKLTLLLATNEDHAIARQCYKRM